MIDYLLATDLAAVAEQSSLSVVPTFLAGFVLGLLLIVAIGAQNAFVLKQGLRRQHVFLVCFVCASSDVVLIALGVSGFSVVVERFPLVEVIARYGGAAFLVLYGALSLLAAIRQTDALRPKGADTTSLTHTLAVCLALTWLNPHAYLDTLVLLGSVSTQYQSPVWFGAGAAAASVIFFYALGYGARLLTPLFRQPQAWRVLNLIIAIVMLSVAATLVFG